MSKYSVPVRFGEGRDKSCSHVTVYRNRSLAHIVRFLPKFDRAVSSHVLRGGFLVSNLQICPSFHLRWHCRLG